jgi:hypothetical protein
MLLRVCSCAPGVSFVDLLCFVRVTALDLAKITNFQFVSHIAKLPSWNYRNVGKHDCICAPGVSVVDLFNISTCNFQLVLCISQKVFDLESQKQSYRNIGHICHCAPGVWFWIYSVFVESWPLTW